MTNEVLARLGEASFSGTVAVVLVWLLCRFVKRLSGNARCWLWWLVCGKLLLSLVPLPAILVSVPVPPATRTMSTHLQRSLVVQVAPSHSSHTATPTVDTVAVAPVASLPVAQVLTVLWLLGVGISLGSQGMALVQLHRLTRGATRQPLPIMEEAARRAGLTWVPALWTTTSPVEPLTVNGRRPFLLLAQTDLERLSSGDLLSVLTHECVHIRRGDLLLSLVPILSQTLFWFLPPVYLALREFSIAREAACDEQTVQALEMTPRAYGELLLKLSSPLSPLTVPSSTMALSAGFHDLKRRIQMLENRTSRRRVLVLATLLTFGVLLPWRWTIAAPPFPQSPLPNLEFGQGLKNWHPMANGSDTEPHPFYSVGVDTVVRWKGKPSGYVRANANIAKDPPGDGGVLRYDIRQITPFRGKRLRWRGYLQGNKIAHHAMLFIGAQTPKALYFATSSDLKLGMSGWSPFECVLDVPADTVGISLGVRLEGDGTAYANGFSLEIVDKSVPLSNLRTINVDDELEADAEAPTNLDFARGLESWWNDNPTHDAEQDYSLELTPKAGRTGGPAALLRSRVAKPHSYGTIGQNAAPGPFLGKRIRFSAYLKGEDVDKGGLWMVVHDKEANKSSGQNASSSGKVIKGTQDWTRFEYVIDIPRTTRLLSFGISSEGKGKVWVDGFTIEVLGPIGSAE